MATYSIFFFCAPEKLLGCFPGWKPALKTSVMKAIKNPFTGKVTEFESFEPEWSDDERAFPQVDRDVDLGGDYQDYLESRVPESVRPLAHLCLKQLTNTELEELHFVATGVRTTFSMPIYSPPGSELILFQIPDELVSRLRGEELRKLSDAWAARMSEPEHTRKGAEQHYLQTSTGETLEMLAALCGKRQDGESLYVLVDF